MRIDTTLSGLMIFSDRFPRVGPLCGPTPADRLNPFRIQISATTVGRNLLKEPGHESHNWLLEF